MTLIDGQVTKSPVMLMSFLPRSSALTQDRAAPESVAVLGCRSGLGRVVGADVVSASDVDLVH